MKKMEFEKRNSEFIKLMGRDKSLRKISRTWFLASHKYEYSYHFTWLGLPIIQYPQDIIALQEIIWRVKPDLIIETGIARGGSIIFSASILELIGHGEVLGIDIDIRQHNKNRIKNHPLYKRITLIEGSSIDKKIIDKVYKFVSDKKRIMVFLDSNHSHNHVLEEMRLYSPLVTKGSYMVVLDTIIEDMPEEFFKGNKKRPWGKGNSPKTAVIEFLKTNNRFENNVEIENKLLVTVAPNGYLKCIKN